MNRIYSVRWNHSRRQYVAASEIQKAGGKAGRTIIAAAVASVLASAGAVQAATPDSTKVVDYDYVVGSAKTTKFISGSGSALEIKTNGDFRKLAAELKAAGGDMNKILAAIAQVDGTHAILTGTAGGGNYVDEAADHLFRLPSSDGIFDGIAAAKLPENIKSMLKKLDACFDKAPSMHEGDTLITIGGDETGPIMIGTVGGDRLVNLGMRIPLIGFGDSTDANIVRNGSVDIIQKSGNVIGLVGGSSAVGAYKVDLKAGGITIQTEGQSPYVEVNGDVNYTLSGTGSAAGVFGGGSAVAFGGNAQSVVTGSSRIELNARADASRPGSFEGIAAGVAGGGLAAASYGGAASSTIKASSINVVGGVNGGLIAGGIAASADPTDLVNRIPVRFSDNIIFDESLRHNPGSAAASVEVGSIKIGSGASAVGVMGGGAALVYQYGDALSAAEAKSRVGTSTIEIGEEGAGSPFIKEDGSVDVEAKSKFFRNVKDAAGQLLSFASDPSKDPFAVLGAGYKAAVQPGFTGLVFGGGMAASLDRERGAANRYNVSQAVSEVALSGIVIRSGYNVGVVGGGLALASGPGYVEGYESSSHSAASSFVRESGVSLEGGETVGVMGGGIAVFAGTRENNRGVGVQADVGRSRITVSKGARVDGIIGGGLAVDDTNPARRDGAGWSYELVDNAQARVDSSSIVVEDAFAGRFAADAFAGNLLNPDVDKKITSYAQSVLSAAAYNDVAIVGGGIAAGLNDQNSAEGSAHVGEVAIVLGKGAKVGSESEAANVFAGGFASAGGRSTVGNAQIRVAGAQVHGDIYGGGYADQGAFTAGADGGYARASAEVGSSAIILESGRVYGDLHAGGLAQKYERTSTDKRQNYKPADLARSVVRESTIAVLDKDVFQGALIDGSGALKSTLVFGEFDADFARGRDEEVKIQGFDAVALSGRIEGAAYDFAGRSSTSVSGGSLTFSRVEGGGSFAVGSESTRGALGVVDPSGGWSASVVNGVLAVGRSAHEAAEAFDAQNVVVDAGLYVSGEFDGSGRSILVGRTIAAEGVVIGSNAALLVDAVPDSGASGVSHVAGEDGSRLHFVDARRAALEGAVVSMPNSQVDGFGLVSTDNIFYKAVYNDASEGFGFEAASSDDLAGRYGIRDENIIDFYSRLDNDDALADRADALHGGPNEQRLRAGMNLAAAAGVQTTAIDAVLSTGESAFGEASLSAGFRDGWSGTALLHNRKFEQGGNGTMGEVEADWGGVSVGGRYVSGVWTAGVLASAGGGDLDGRGDNSGVKNEFEFYSLNGYAARRFGDFSVSGRLGYAWTRNELSESGAFSVKADVDAEVLSAGLRGEAQFALSAKCRVVPYIGLDYLRVSTDAYAASNGVRVGSAEQNLFQVPIGAAFTGVVETSDGWIIKPVVDAAYVGSFGDRSVEARTFSGSVSGVDPIDVWAKNMGRVKLGVEAQKGAWSFGLDLGAAAGSDDAKSFFGRAALRRLF